MNKTKRHRRRRRRIGFACPVASLDRIAALRAFPRGMAGVSLLTRLVGRQYWIPVPADPHGLLLLLSTHFSAVHLRREAPAAVFFTIPCFRRHLATAWAALADHLPPYVRIVFW